MPNMTYPCGCINAPDPASGVMRSVSKCPQHKRQMGRGGLAYYEELKCLKKGKRIPTSHADEFKDALDRGMGAKTLRDPKKGFGTCLEIGAGVGVYVDWVQTSGYWYEALEPDIPAARFMAVEYGVVVHTMTFEEYLAKPHFPVDLVLAAHVIEHFKDSPAMVRAMHNLLKPGGRALFLIPDDSDPTNPDHLWFYTPETFRHVLEQAGFVDIRMVVRKIVPHENFIYVSCYRREE